MMLIATRSIVGTCLLLLCGAAPADDSSVAFTAAERKAILALSPVPATAKDTTNAADGNRTAILLGQLLFFDSHLSGDGRFSCASCHERGMGWTDGKRVATAVGVGTRNTPSLWNVAQNRWFFWDGHADSLWSQALKPIENELEQNGSRLQVAHFVTGDATLRSLYVKVFGAAPDLSDLGRFPPLGGPLASDDERQQNWYQMAPDDQQTVDRVYSNVGKAIAAFEATIKTGEAPFDRFVKDLRVAKPQSQAISPSAQRGLKVFIGKGDCVLCHSGPNFTNKEFHDIRVPPLDANAPRDEGRNEGLTRLATDEFVASGPYSDDPQGARAQQLYFLDSQLGSSGHFKTPGLRNVATTAPYMHAGQEATLRDAVAYYSTLEGAVAPADPKHVETLIRPLHLSDREIDDVVAFLESLTSEPATAAPAAAASVTEARTPAK
jgi:cytochrome c peroxidase